LKDVDGATCAHLILSSILAQGSFNDANAQQFRPSLIGLSFINIQQNISCSDDITFIRITAFIARIYDICGENVFMVSNQHFRTIVQLVADAKCLR
jgi:hypothetical protein